jgi:hypothetical protein
VDITKRAIEQGDVVSHLLPETRNHFDQAVEHEASLFFLSVVRDTPTDCRSLTDNLKFYTPFEMGKQNGKKGGPRRAAGSFFANLPQDLKSQLRSQSFPEPIATGSSSRGDSMAVDEVR